MAGYSVTFTVVDQATAQINAINKRIQQLRAPLEKQAQAMSKFIDVSGLRAVENGFKRIAGAALSTASAMSKIVPAMGALTGAATIAGIGKLVTDFANLASELTKTGALLDETPERLSGVAQAMRSIGGNAQTAIDALVELKNTTYDAALGMNSVAAAAFARLGVAIVDTGNNFRDVIDVEGDLFKALDKMPNAMDRQREALRVGGQALADTYQQYKLAGITEEEWIRRQKEMETLNKDRTRTFLQFQTSLAKVNTAFYDLGIKISGAVAPVLTDLFTRLSTWVDNNAPEITATVERVATAFENWAKNGGFNEIAKGLGAIGDALIKIFHVMEWMEAHPIITGAVLGGLVGGRFGGVYGAAGGAAAGAVGGAYGGAKNDDASPARSPRGEGVIPPAPAATPTPATPGPQGAAGGAPAAFKAAIEKVESEGGYSNYPQPGHSATGPRQMMPATFAQWAKPGESISNPEDNRRVSDRMIDALWTKYGGNAEMVANAYANGSPVPSDKNPGYAGKVLAAYGNPPPVAAAAPGGVPKGVNPELHQTMAAAFASVLPPGYTAKMISGVRGGNPNSQHYTGSAEDWQIYDSKGQPVPNSGADRSGLYHAAAVAGLASLMQTNPALAKRFAWGGHFETSAGSGTPDLMHYDIGGPRGRFGDPMAERAEAALLAARGPNQQLAGGGMPNGNVNIDINHKNAPAGVSVAANLVTGGGINVNPPRVEHQAFGQI